MQSGLCRGTGAATTDCAGSSVVLHGPFRRSADPSGTGPEDGDVGAQYDSGGSRLDRLSRPDWLAHSELRIGLGCMRLSTEEDRDETLALATIAAAAAAGITIFDTARAYGRGPGELGHNERLVARALRERGAAARARIVTKGGMTRAGGGWIRTWSPR